MKVTVLFLLCVCMYACQGQGDNDKCVAPWKQIGSSCYLFQQQKVSPNTAFALCSHHNAYLVNLETLEEALLIQYEIRQMKTGLNFMVGGRNINRYLPSGDWRWIKRGHMTKLTYFAFGAGEPNGHNGAPQDCMFMFANDHYQFHSVFCYDTSLNGGYICEK